MIGAAVSFTYAGRPLARGLRPPLRVTTGGLWLGSGYALAVRGPNRPVHPTHLYHPYHPALIKDLSRSFLDQKPQLIHDQRGSWGCAGGLGGASRGGLVLDQEVAGTGRVDGDARAHGRGDHDPA
jgi:hypothetical protein